MTLPRILLDVIEGEPDLGADHSLARYARAHPERLILTPHIGGNTRESFEKTEVFLADRVLAALGLLP
jgi:D-3-phosphoglycerate dehydrogenase / 2-oxoglutarate reductase